MAIVENRAERSRGWFNLSFLSREKATTVKKPQVLKLQMVDIFIPDNIAFTQFGQELYGTLITRSSISDSQISEARRNEVISEVRERCKKLKVNEDQLPLIHEQFMNLIEKRNSEINNQKPVLSSQR